MDALGRYTKDSKESGRETAAKLGIRRSILWDWLSGKTRPQKCALARLAGFKASGVFETRGVSIEGGDRPFVPLDWPGLRIGKIA